MWFILVLGSVFVNAVGEIAQKLSLSSDEDLSSEAVNFYVAIIQTVLSLIYVFIFNKNTDLNLSTNDALLLIIGSILSFFFFKFLYSSYKGNSVSISQVIFSLSVFVTTILGILFFNESFTLFKVLGAFLIVSAVILVQYEKKSKLSKYNAFALLAAFIYGFLATIDKAVSISYDPHMYQVMFAGLFVFTSIVFSGKKIFKESKRIRRSHIKTFIVAALAFTIFNKLTFVAYANGGEVGRVDAINNTAIFLIILFEFFILKEHSNLKRKIIGAILSVLGIFILGFL